MPIFCHLIKQLAGKSDCLIPSPACRLYHQWFAGTNPLGKKIACPDREVLTVHGNLIEVSGLDILDGTPILDIKKKITR